jgi:hypothetical protein
MPENENKENHDHTLKIPSPEEMAEDGLNAGSPLPASLGTEGVGEQEGFSPERTRELVTHMAQIMSNAKRPPTDSVSPEETKKNDIHNIIHMDSDAVAEQLFMATENAEDLQHSDRNLGHCI